MKKTNFFSATLEGKFCFSVLVCVLSLISVGAPSEARTITFAGRVWDVKSGTGGPGPNNWSDSTQSVWVDSPGLHLKIRKVGSTWYCAEVSSVEPTKYGMHRFYIASRIDQLDKNVVASPFLYKNDNQEIDIEFSTWVSSWPWADNAQYVVQPYFTPGNRHTFDCALNGYYSTHYINWSSSLIRFKSFHGHYLEPPSSGYLIQDWTYTASDNPPESANLRIHMNVWLIGGNPPSDGQEVEFIIKDADLPQPPIPPPSKPVNPSPSNGATNQSIDVDISWSDGGGATSYNVYFGTDPTPDITEYKGNQTGTSYDPGTLAYSTTYYWRINTKNSQGTTTGYIWHFTTEAAPAGPPNMTVSPSDGLSSSGQVGGPFSPSSKTYTVKNTGGGTLSWSVSNREIWVSLSWESGGSLGAGQSTTTTVFIGSDARTLPRGSYSDTVSFTNNTNGQGNTSRNVSLSVHAPGAPSLNVTIEPERARNAGAQWRVDGGS